MIKYEKITLANGLRVIVHTDKLTPMVAVNVVYNVGSKQEDPGKTGFAHLFEHLMFGGSANVDDFDDYVQDAGGESNAMTNTDMTQFYEILPAANIETALWLESDRMLQLSINEKVLRTQKNVVIEEFKEVCLNEPYGDMWHHLCGLAYTKHPYQWPTIGKELSHIAQATLPDVKAFFDRFYTPDNAILVIAGNISTDEAFRLAEKWFGDIPRGDFELQPLPQEPIQTAPRSKIVHASVPANAIYTAYPTLGRLSPKYYAADLLSDVLANGRSSRFFQKLLKGTDYFNAIDAYMSGTVDNGLMIIESKLMPNITFDQAKKVINQELDLIKNEPISPRVLEKLKNTTESSIAFSETSLLNKSSDLAYYELIGDAGLINLEREKYDQVTVSDIQEVANEIFDDNKINEVLYMIQV